MLVLFDKAITVYFLSIIFLSPVQAAIVGDSDGDGVVDSIDNCLNVSNLEQVDSDDDP